MSGPTKSPRLTAGAFSFPLPAHVRHGTSFCDSRLTVCVVTTPRTAITVRVAYSFSTSRVSHENHTRDPRPVTADTISIAIVMWISQLIPNVKVRE